MRHRMRTGQACLLVQWVKQRGMVRELQSPGVFVRNHREEGFRFCPRWTLPDLRSGWWKADAGLIWEARPYRKLTKKSLPFRVSGYVKSVGALRIAVELLAGRCSRGCRSRGSSGVGASITMSWIDDVPTWLGFGGVVNRSSRRRRLEGRWGPSSRRSLLTARFRVKRCVKDWLIRREFIVTLLITDPFRLNFSSLAGLIVCRMGTAAVFAALMWTGEGGLFEDLYTVGGVAGHTGRQVVFLHVFSRRAKSAD